MTTCSLQRYTYPLHTPWFAPSFLLVCEVYPYMDPLACNLAEVIQSLCSVIIHFYKWQNHTCSCARFLLQNHASCGLKWSIGNIQFLKVITRIKKLLPYFKIRINFGHFGMYRNHTEIFWYIPKRNHFSISNCIYRSMNTIQTEQLYLPNQISQMWRVNETPELKYDVELKVSDHFI